MTDYFSNNDFETHEASDKIVSWFKLDPDPGAYPAIADSVGEATGTHEGGSAATAFVTTGVEAPLSNAVLSATPPVGDAGDPAAFYRVFLNGVSQPNSVDIGATVTPGAAGVPAVFDSKTRTGACGDWCEGPPSVEAAAESALALADAIEAIFKPTAAKNPGAAAALDAANVRWSPCSGGAAALGAFPGTEGVVPAMAEVAAAPGGGGRGCLLCALFPGRGCRRLFRRKQVVVVNRPQAADRIRVQQRSRESGDFLPGEKMDLRIRDWGVALRSALVSILHLL